MKIEICVWSDGEELSADISGFYGSFGVDGFGIAQLIGSEKPYMEHIIKQIEHEPYCSWTVWAEVTYVPPELHYGTFSGDIIVLAGYYQVGKIVKLKKHCIDPTA